MQRVQPLGHSRFRGKLVWFFAVAVCGGAVALLLANREYARQLWLGLTRIPLPTVLFALFLIVLQVLCQALRFWAIIPRVARVSVSLATRAFTLGECANTVTPGRAGDVMKAMLMNRPGSGADVNLSRAAGAVLADKVIDIGSMLLICAASGTFGLIAAGARAALPSPPVAMALGVVLPLAMAGAWLTRATWLPRIRSAAGEVTIGLSALKAPGSVLASVAFSIGAWSAELLALQVLCGGMGFSPTISQLLLAVIVLNASVLVPISVANVGVYEAALAFGLKRVDIPVTAALAIAIAHHALELLALGLTTLGLLLAARIGRANILLQVPQ